MALLRALALQPASNPAVHAFLLKREPALTLVGIVLQDVLEAPERTLAAERDVEKPAQPVVGHGGEKLGHVAVPDLGALIRDRSVPCAELCFDLLRQLIIVAFAQPDNLTRLASRNHRPR